MTFTLQPLSSAANTHGVQFELKMAALVALRAQQREGTFELFRNVAVALPFDDLVLRLSEGSTTSLYFIQLKHGDKGGKNVGLQAFAVNKQHNLNKFFNIYRKWHEKLEKKEVEESKDETFLRETSLNETSFISYAKKVIETMERDISKLEKREIEFPERLGQHDKESGDFNLRKYFESFEKLHEIYQKREGDLSEDEKFIRKTPLERLHFIIFTNKIVKEMKKKTQTSDCEFLSTKGGTSSFQFDESVPQVWNLLGDDDRGKLYREKFLSRLRVFHEQVHVSQLDELILEEVQKIVKKPLPTHMARQVVRKIHKEIKEWANANSGECLPSGLLEQAVAAELRRQAWTMTQRLHFKEEHCVQLKEAVQNLLRSEPTRRLQVSVAGVPAGVRVVKLLQVLDTIEADKESLSKWTYLSDITLEVFEHSFLTAVCNTCEIIIWDNDLPGNDSDLEKILLELKKVLYVIHLKNENSIEGCHGVFKDIWTLRQLTDECQDRFINRFINFQGKLIKLKELEGNWGTMRDDVDGCLLAALGRKKPKFGRDILFFKDEMMPRRLSHFHQVSSRALTDKTVLIGARLALQGFPKDLLKEAAHRLGLLGSRTDAELEKILKENLRWTVICYENETSPKISKQYLKSLVEGKAMKDIHWVEYISGDSVDEVCMVWRESFGSHDSMKKLVEPLFEDSCSSETVVCVHQFTTPFEGLNRALLVGEPGNGKTSFILSLASKMKRHDPQQWIVPVKFLEHRELLREWNKVETLSLNHVVELVARAAGADAGAARRCLQVALRCKGSVTVLVDGVDEVAPAFTDLTLRILDLLDHTSVRRIWVTSRPEVETSLRHVVRSPPLALHPLEIEEQEVLVDFCLTLDRSSQNVRSIAQWTNQMLGGSPLYLKMVVDILNVQPELFKQSTISLFELYEKFSTMKQEEYERKYSRLPHTQSDFEEKHEKCAILYMFADHDKANGLPLREYAEFISTDNSLSEAEEKTGIVWKVGNTLTFTHQTFAEFFASKWLFRNAGSSKAVHNFVLELMGPKHNWSRIARFLQEQLAKDWPLHAAACRRDMQEVQRLTEGDFRQHWDSRDTWLKWTFGECVSWAYKDSITLHPEEETFHDPWLIVILRAAAESGCPSVVAEVMRRADLPHSTVRRALRALLRRGQRSSGHTEVARLLLETGVEEDSTSQYSLLHVAAEGGIVSMVDLLLKHTQNVNARDILMRTPLHVAIGEWTVHNHKAAHRLIEEESVDVDAEDKDGNTPLCYASVRACVSCTEALLVRGAKVDGGRVPALCLMAQRNNTRFMRLLIQKGASVNATDEEGRSPLHHSAVWGRMEAMNLLLSEDADIRLMDKGGRTAMDIAVLLEKADIALVLDNFSKCSTIVEKNKQLAHWQLMIDLTAAANTGSPDKVRGILERSTFAPLELKRALLAASQGESRDHTEVTRILLQHGAKDVPTRKRGVDFMNNEMTSLHYAAKAGNVQTVDLLLRNFHDANQRDACGRTPLHLAIRRNKSEHRHEATQCLLIEECDVDAVDENGETPLLYALDVDCVSCAESLLLRGAKVDGGRVPALYRAAKRNNTNFIRLLVQKGASVNGTDVVDSPPLHLSTAHGNLEAVCLLLSEAADIHLKDKEGQTALDIAIAMYRDDIATVLENFTFICNSPIDKEKQLGRLKLIADLKAAAQRGSQDEVRGILASWTLSPLELKRALLAATKGESRCHTEVTRILLDHGAKDVPTTKRGEMASLHYAAKAGNVQTVDLLLNRLQDVNQRDELGRTALHLAVGWSPREHRHEATQRLLQEESVDANAEDEYGVTPLCYTSAADCVSCAESLLLRGAKVDGGRLPALCIAAGKNNTKFMRMLLKNGAQVNARDDMNACECTGRSALHYAVEYKRKDSVQLLLLEGADVCLRNSSGETALDIAIRGRVEEIARILKQHHGSDKKRQRLPLEPNMEECIRHAVQEANDSAPLPLADAAGAATGGQ